MNLIRGAAFLLILSPREKLGLEGRKAKDLMSEE